MDQLLEESLLKRKDGLHSQINTLINQLCDETKLKKSHSDQINRSKGSKVLVIANKIKVLVQEFEPSPNLLDSSLSRYIDSLSLGYSNARESDVVDDILESIAVVVYTLSKIRGFKYITNYFSSDVYMVPKLLLWMEDNTKTSDSQQFLILLWLSNLVLVPFQLQQISPDIPDRLFSMSLRALGQYSKGSKNQIMISILLSRLLTRSDSKVLLNDYFMNIIPPVWSLNLTNKVYPSSLKLGHMITINKILKRIDGSSNNDYYLVVRDILDHDFAIVQSDCQDQSDFTNMNVLYLIKLSQRWCLYELSCLQYLPVADNINQLFQRILFPLSSAGKLDTSLRYALAKTLSNICTHLSTTAVNYQDQIINYILNDLEISNLQMDSPNDSVFDPDLDIRPDYVSTSHYHTVLLFLGYLTLKKSLPTSYIPVVLSIIHKTLFFSQKLLTVTLGSQIRDSSCFVLWAISRSIPAREFPKIVDSFTSQTILYDLFQVAIFDTDLIIRRCGIAVLQEYIGRFGLYIFEFERKEIDLDGELMGGFIIEFIQLFDTPSVSTLAASYEIIPKLIYMGFNVNFFISILMNQINDPDVDFHIKKLSAISLNEIITNNIRKQYDLKNHKSDDLQLWEFSRITHDLCKSIKSEVPGALYSISAILFSQPEQNLENELDLIVRYVAEHFSFDIHTDSHEKGEEFTSFFTAILNAEYFNGEPQLESLYWDHLFEISRVSFNSDLVKQIQCLFEIATSCDQISDDLQDRIISLIKHNNLNLASSIGYLSDINSSFMQVIVNMIENKKGVQAETRAELIKSLSHHFKMNAINIEIIPRILNMLDDYTITIQGDVGSKIRSSVLDFIKDHLPTLQKHSNLITEVYSKVVRLSTEALDSLRMQAMAILIESNDFATVSPLSSNTELYFQNLFQFYTKNLLEDPTLRKSFWSGYVFCVGMANHSLINTSLNTLLKYLESTESSFKSIFFMEMLKLLGSPKEGLKSLPPRTLKRYTATLNTLLYLFESGTTFPTDFNYEALYIRCYNLHINTANSQRIGLVIKMFQYISCLNLDISMSAKKRLCWLACKHSLPGVRLMSGEALLEVVIEMDSCDPLSQSFIIDTEWDMPTKELVQKYKTLECVIMN
ncbi:hypothetical protein CAAN1_13S01838 [[Candida] anglica]|uniref:Tubulin-specific chaperone D C-terminal domain-containing protein n=1 Tax=[Candida] anglica TaxID=148631 RepID=A0ABP0EKN2_9ASCO